MSTTAIENTFSVQASERIASHTLTIGAHSKLTLADIKSFVQHTLPVNLNQKSYPLMERSFRFLCQCIEQRIPVYGINTHFGDQVRLLDTQLKNENKESYYQSINERQINIVKSLSCGLGDIISVDIVRVTILLRAHCLGQGYSGVNPHVVDSLLAYLNAGITPIVRRYGSIGASGDLIPLATIAAGMLGENVDVFYKNQRMQALKALELAGLKKYSPKFRDGLALINGTSFMSAIASLTFCNLQRLFWQMLAAIAMSLESMLVISSAYHPLVHQVKKHPGECRINDFFVNFWQGSHLLSDLDELRATCLNNAENKPMQDFYSLRSVPQGFGPFYDNLERTKLWLEAEINSVNDNPIIDATEEKIHHGANFMGYYVTDTCDILKMNIAQASTWIHALLANMVHARKNCNLPTNLAIDPGKNNGFRSIQLLAAALAVQNRKLAQAQQSFMLPTEGDNQDVNSLGTHAALDLQESVANLERLTALLFLASAQALEFRGIQKASKESQKFYQLIRTRSPQLIECRPMSDEIVDIIDLMQRQII